VAGASEITAVIAIVARRAYLIFGDYRGDTAVAALKGGAPDPSWRKGPGATGAMPTTVAASPSPQGHELKASVLCASDEIRAWSRHSG
jgi:hypothetical protein